jgi:hypothetical protein
MRTHTTHNEMSPSATASTVSTADTDADADVGTAAALAAVAAAAQIESRNININLHEKETSDTQTRPKIKAKPTGDAKRAKVMGEELQELQEDDSVDPDLRASDVNAKVNAGTDIALRSLEEHDHDKIERLLQKHSGGIIGGNGDDDDDDDDNEHGDDDDGDVPLNENEIRELREHLDAIPNSRIRTKGMREAEKILANSAISLVAMNNVNSTNQKFPIEKIAEEKKLISNARRAAQNRESQRAFRQRRKAKMEELEREAALFKTVSEENQRLRAENEELKKRIDELLNKGSS